MDLLFQEADGYFTFYDPKTHGVWELAKVEGDTKLRPRLVLNALDSAALLEALNKAESQHDFDAKDEKDAREKAMRAIALRRGQPEFRRDLIAAYEGRCAVTGCDVIDALEAAHIIPYKGPHTNVARNGLLLRADIHTLFDLKLFRIDPDSFKVVLSPQLAASKYGELAGVKIRLPKLPALQPDAEALRIQGKASTGR
jgi:putative restriction endonuclease